MAVRYLTVVVLGMVLATGQYATAVEPSAVAVHFATEKTGMDDKTPNVLTDAEKAEGWILLFDGKTIDGWRNYKKDGISDGWKVVDGVLTRVKDGAGDIITKNEFAAFELSLDYKIAKGTNSGIMFHVLEAGKKPWETGPEVQIIDNDALAGHENPQFAGWLYQLYQPDAGVDATNPPGQWNHVRLLVTPEKCQTDMNGVKYYEYVIGSDDWNQRVAEGKFKALPSFAKSKTGHICLQDHNGEIAFRNIKLRKFKYSTPSDEEK